MATLLQDTQEILNWDMREKEKEQKKWKNYSIEHMKSTISEVRHRLVEMKEKYGSLGELRERIDDIPSNREDTSINNTAKKYLSGSKAENKFGSKTYIHNKEQFGDKKEKPQTLPLVIGQWWEIERETMHKIPSNKFDLKPGGRREVETTENHTRDRYLARTVLNLEQQYIDGGNLLSKREQDDDQIDPDGRQLGDEKSDLEVGEISETDRSIVIKDALCLDTPRSHLQVKLLRTGTGTCGKQGFKSLLCRSPRINKRIKMPESLQVKSASLTDRMSHDTIQQRSLVNHNACATAAENVNRKMLKMGHVKSKVDCKRTITDIIKIPSVDHNVKTPKWNTSPQTPNLKDRELKLSYGSLCFPEIGKFNSHTTVNNQGVRPSSAVQVLKRRISLSKLQPQRNSIYSELPTKDLRL